jgi:hypothetical protein
MVFLAEQKLRQALPEPLDVQVALNRARVTNRNLAAFFGDDDGNGVGFLGEPESGSVTETQRPVEIVPLRQGEDAARRHDPVACHDDAAVVKDRLGVKEGEHQLFGKSRVEDNACFCDGL